MGNKIKGSEIVIRSILDHGADMVFGYPGGTIMPVYDSLHDFKDTLTHILARHEQGAIHMAEGYARVSGRTGVVVATSGPGAMNLITGLNDAMMDSVPLVVVTGQVQSSLLGKDAFQESDVVSVTLPVTKWTVQVRRPEDIAPAMAKAFYIAASGRPGPVVVDVTKDAQTQSAEYLPVEVDFMRSYNPDPEIPERLMAEAAEMIDAAERPMILSGHGVMIAEAEAELLEFAEKAGIPVACTMLGLSTIPSSHPLNKGMLGMHGNLGPNINTNKADLLIAVGMRFDDRVTGDVAKYAPDAKIIHIDIDESEFDKTVNSNLHLHGDARKALRRLIPMIKEREHKNWNDSFIPHERVEASRVMAAQLADGAMDEALHMGEVVRAVSEAYGNDAVLVTDVGQNQMMSVRYFGFKSPKSCISSGGLGTMGFGFPAAIGAKLGAPSRDVVLFVGDGGFQMTMQELGTVMEYGVNVKIVLLNNNFLGNVRQWQHLFFEGRYSATPLLNPDFRMLTEAYGIKAEDVSTRADFADALERMKNHDGAYLLNVNIRPMDMVFPMTPPGAGVDEIMLDENERYNP